VAYCVSRRVRQAPAGRLGWRSERPNRLVCLLWSITGRQVFRDEECHLVAEAGIDVRSKIPLGRGPLIIDREACPVAEILPLGVVPRTVWPWQSLRSDTPAMKDDDD
jgi:hypothetical protein